MSLGKILVVDDDRDALKLMNLRLKKAGYEVVFAGDGVACVSTARKEKPDLILLDLGLPAGDGFLALKRLRDNIALSSLPVIVLTGPEGEEVRKKVLAEGADDFFSKTDSPEDLLAAIARHLGADAPELE